MSHYNVYDITPEMRAWKAEQDKILLEERIKKIDSNTPGFQMNCLFAMATSGYREYHPCTRDMQLIQDAFLADNELKKEALKNPPKGRVYEFPRR